MRLQTGINYAFPLNVRRRVDGFLESELLEKLGSRMQQMHRLKARLEAV